MAKCRTKLNRIASEIRYLEAEQADRIQQLQVIERLDDFTAKIGANVQSLDFDRKKAIVRLLVKEIKVDTHNHQVEIEHLLPVDQHIALRSDDPSAAAASASGALRGVRGAAQQLAGGHHPNATPTGGGSARRLERLAEPDVGACAQAGLFD